jgi:hypothetical protein
MAGHTNISILPIFANANSGSVKFIAKGVNEQPNGKNAYWQVTVKIIPK